MTAANSSLQGNRMRHSLCDVCARSARAWLLRVGNPCYETVRWYTETVITNFVGGAGQPFDNETIKSILPNTRLEDLDRLREPRTR